ISFLPAANPNVRVNRSSVKRIIRVKSKPNSEKRNADQAQIKIRPRPVQKAKRADDGYVIKRRPARIRGSETLGLGGDERRQQDKDKGQKFHIRPLRRRRTAA